MNIPYDVIDAVNSNINSNHNQIDLLELEKIAKKELKEIGIKYYNDITITSIMNNDEIDISFILSKELNKELEDFERKNTEYYI